MTPEALGRALRAERGPHLARRPWVVGLSLVGTTLVSLAVVALAIPELRAALVGTLRTRRRAPRERTAPIRRSGRGTGSLIGARHGWHLGPLTIPRPWPQWPRGARA